MPDRSDRPRPAPRRIQDLEHIIGAADQQAVHALDDLDVVDLRTHTGRNDRELFARKSRIETGAEQRRPARLACRLQCGKPLPPQCCGRL